MQGVEILTSAHVSTGLTANWSVFWVTTLIVFGACIMIGFVSTIETSKWSDLFGWSMIGIIIGPLLGLIGALFSIAPTGYETRYKITISEEVSMTEFYEHYEVIDQDGKIFTVREKTNE